MKIENEFTVDVPIARAWEVLTDLEGVAPCLPGAVLTGRDGEDYLGRVKVRLGPVTSEFSGKARFVEKDEVAYRAVIDAQGREVRGSGNASAAVTAQLRQDGGRTVVSVDTDLRIAGKIAQFGAGMIQQVSTTLLGEFADRLEHKLAASGPSDPAAAPEAALRGADVPVSDATASVSVQEPEVLNLLTYARGAIARRLVPIAVAVIVLALVLIVVL